MHYYQFNIGDYAKHTRHLTLIEDLAYRRLLDFYYTSEKDLTNNIDKLSRLIGMQKQKKEVGQVLEDFFILGDSCFYQKRVRDEINKYRSKADAARINGKKGGRPRKPNETQSVNLDNPEETESKTNHKPITINHKPLTKNNVKALSSVDNIPLDIFNHWCVVMKKNGGAKFTPKRVKAVNERLEDGYTPEQIKSAIDGCSMTPHNRGINDQGKRFDCLELICRNGDNIERFSDKFVPNVNDINNIGTDFSAPEGWDND